MKNGPDKIDPATPEPIAAPGTAEPAPQAEPARDAQFVQPDVYWLKRPSASVSDFARNPVRPWHLGLGMGLLALVLYLTTLSWLPATRASLAFLVAHLGLDASLPLTDLPWDLWCRVASHLPWLTVSTWTALLCAALGASAVGLLTALLARVTYFFAPDVSVSSLRRESVARRISAVTGGAYLMVVFPFWWASTRAMPQTLLVVTLLASALLISLFQETGRLRWLALFSFLWGVGCAWNAVYWLLSLPVLFLVLREFFNKDMLKRFGAYASAFFPFALGGSAILGALAWSWWHGGSQLYAAPAELLQAYSSALVSGLGVSVAMTPILLLLCAVAFAPWGILFPLSRRIPLLFERGQILLRLLLAAHIYSLLFNIPYAPWHVLGGLEDPYLIPPLFLAACAGYIAGEFWCIAEIFPFKDSSRAVRARKRALALLALLMAPLCFGTGLAANLSSVVRARAGASLWNAAQKALDERGERTFFFADRSFDDAVALAAYERQEPIFVFRSPDRCPPLYLSRIRAIGPKLTQLVDRRAAYPMLVAGAMSLPDFPENCVFLPGPEYIRNLVRVVPCGYAWHSFTPRGERQPVPPGELVRRERPFYAAAAAWRARELPAGSVEAACRDYLNGIAARYANDLAVGLAHEMDYAAALDLAKLASEADPDNLSARLNAIQFEEMAAPSASALQLELWPGLPPGDPRIAELDEFATRTLPAASRAWSLCVRDGLLAAPDAWFLAGLPWATSGSLIPMAAFAKPADSYYGLRHESDRTALWFQCVFGRIGTAILRPDQICVLMARDPDDPAPLAELARIHLMRGRPRHAAAALDAALARVSGGHPGYPLEEVLVDAALAGFLHYRFPPHRDTLDDIGAPPSPRYPRRWVSRALFPVGLRQALLQIVSENPSDMNPWLALWMLEPNTSVGRMASQKLRARLRDRPILSLTLAAVFLRSSHPKGPRAAEYILDAAVGELTNSPVAWRLTYDAASGSDNPTASHLAYLKLRTLLPRPILESILPAPPPSIFAPRAVLGTRPAPSLGPILPSFTSGRGPKAEEE